MRDPAERETLPPHSISERSCCADPEGKDMRIVCEPITCVHYHRNDVSFYIEENQYFAISNACIMKQSTLLFFLLSVVLISPGLKAQGTESINWTEHPLHPVPFPYTANHMKLKGKVKEMKETVIGEKIIKYKYEFNTDGYLKKRTDSVSGKYAGYVEYKDTVFYNIQGQQDVIEVKSVQGNNTRSLLSFKNGKLVKKGVFGSFSTIAGSSLQLKDSMIHEVTAYNYNEKELLSKITYSDAAFSNRRVDDFTYNEAGQLIKQEQKRDKYEKGWVQNIWTDIKKGVDIYLDEISYEKDGALLKVQIKKQLNNTGSIKIIEVYDKDGLLVKRNQESINQETTYQYSFDSNNNWILRRETVKNGVSGKETVKYTYRIISYY